MCGIAGLFRRDGTRPGDRAAVVGMTSAQIHRGPDGDGLFLDQRVVLGHRRLSIIDLSAAGVQPMANEDRTIWVTYNGEIYNHRELRDDLASLGHDFRSRADSEVIVHGYEQWGLAGLLERLRGMFAVGLYDPRVGLLLARDRVGIKPLYYYADAGAGLLLFASEVKALIASGLVPPTRDPAAVTGFLLGGSVPAPRTIVSGVWSLMPGHLLVCGLDGAIRSRRYWDLPNPARDERPETSETSAVTGRVRSLLEDSVSRHLVSDVPLGVFLSGGMDSGGIVALASRRADGERLTTLTVTFDEEEWSEADEARNVAHRFGTDHREVRVTGGVFRKELPAIIGAMDQPSNDGVNTWFVAKAARETGLTVVLSGLGGDEIFRGYKHYEWIDRGGPWMRHCPSVVRQALARGAAAWGRLRGKDNWMRMGFLAPRASYGELYLLMRGFFPPNHIMDLMGIGQDEIDAAVERQFDGVSPPEAGGDRACGFNYIEFKRYLHDQLLRDADVFAMAHSIEVRVPFLDHLVIEYTATVLPGVKQVNGINKPLLAAAVGDPLLSRAGTAAKRGFSFPMDRWMRAASHELEEMAMSGGILDRRAVRALWAQFRANRLHWSRAWALTVLGATTH
jgi:asparagine synthase (glutamine-hydrolysing)